MAPSRSTLGRVAGLTTVLVVALSVVALSVSRSGASGSLVDSGWGALGGVSQGAPATTTWDPGRLDVFVRGSDNQLWHNWDAGGWWGWEPLGAPPGGLTSAPGAVAWASGRIDVFAVGTDNQLWHKWYQARWSGWEPLGGVIVGTPAVASWASGRLDVFVRGTDDQLWHKWYQAGWSGWEPLGGTLGSGPAATSWAQGRIDVVVAGVDGSAFHTYYDGGWHPFDFLGGQVVGDPAMSTWASGRLDVLVRGTDDNLYDQWYAGGWSGWQFAFAGPIASGPAAVSRVSGAIDVFAIGTDGGVYYALVDGAAAISSLETMDCGLGGYRNPLRAISGLIPERVDQGVDYAGSGPIYAVGDGVVLNTTNAGWPGGAFISYQLLDGPAQGLIVYVAENVVPQVSIGAQVNCSTVVGTLVNAWPNLEIGWAAPPGTGDAAARAAGQWSAANDANNIPTAFGENFSQLLDAFGAPPGISYAAPVGSLPLGWPNW
jgi:hypothetical protein